MKPAAALVASVLLALTGLLLLPAPAQAQARTVPGPLRLDLTDMSPRLVTATGPTSLTVTGTLTNTGAVPVDQIEVRIQRGDPLGTEGELRDALDGNAGTDATAPRFTSLVPELAPGARAPLTLTVPLLGEPSSSLALGGPGVHELLVNVNGVPRDGERARLAAVRLLLPVLALPGTPPGSGGGPEPTRPAPFSMIYPIADAPHRLSTVPGARTLLADDGLTASLAPGGRLGGLVGALTQQAPVGSRVRAATCVAVDPDLVETAAAMRAGYDVLGADGKVVPGAGGAVAGQWLTQLTAATRGGCVLALPYADADLVALTRGGLGREAGAAITTGRQVLSAQLGTAVLPGVTWPAAGLADDPTVRAAGAAGGRALLLSADGIDGGRAFAGTLPVAGSSQFAVLSDPLLARAAGGGRTETVTAPGPGGAAPTSSPAGTETPLSTQDAIGAIAFRARADPPSGPLILAPAHRWDTDGNGARALLQAVGDLIDAGALTPDPPATLLTTAPAAGTPARPVTYPFSAGPDEIPASVVATVATTAANLTDLRSAVVPGTGVGIGADEVFAPLVDGLVRPASAALRDDATAATAAAAAGAARIDAVRATVRVLEPPSPYSLGTSDAPLPLTVANGLPLTVQVQIEISSTSGLRVAPIAPVQIPPLGRRQVSVNAKVTRSGQFTVDASVRTPAGGDLGPASRLRVRSTVYGTITVWLTVGAGVLLVVLVARRLVRRIRGRAGRPGPDARTDPDLPPGPPEPPTQPLTLDPALPAAPNGRASTPEGPWVAAPEDLVDTDRILVDPVEPRTGPPRAPNRA